MKKDNDTTGLDYSTKDAQILLKEFVILLHDISTNYEITISRLENNYRREINELKNLVKYYENNNTVAVKLLKIKRHAYFLFKNCAKVLAIFVFRIAKIIFEKIKIKEQIRRTNLYKKICRSSYIDKLKGRV